MPKLIPKVDVIAFVDWKSQIHNAGQIREERVSRQCQATLEYVTTAIDKFLVTLDKNARFGVDIRLYHGWHQGLTKTSRRRELELLLHENMHPKAVGQTHFNWQSPFGDRLLDAHELRLHARTKCHLPDTLRQEEGVYREKMVDTALAADFLFSARTSPETWRLLVAEDDDFIPPLFVAERWSQGKGRTLVLRRRTETGHQNLKGLLYAIS
jgi:hypothetical protein